MAITTTALRRTSFRSVLCAALLLAGIVSFAQERAVRAVETGESKTSAPELRISAGDLLEVTVFEVPELAARVRVSSTGEIALPLVGAMPVQGKTSEEAARLLEQRLRDGGFVKQPQASVFISQYATQGVAVLGEVKKPGIYPLLGSHRLFDFISVAEGLTPAAGKAITITHRDSSSEQVVTPWTGSATANPQVNVPVFPGDTIVVPKAGVVYVIGDVAKPGGFLMDHKESLTVLQAIALAQGANRTAALGSAKLIRNGESGRTAIPIPLNKILANKTADVPLRDDDIVFVPASGRKSFGYRGLEAIIQSATGLAIYHP